MSDPAAEAHKVINEMHGPCSLRENTLMTKSAREALKPIRELHKPGPLLPLSTAWMEGAKEECRHCRRAWPCATARLAYSSEELS